MPTRLPQISLLHQITICLATKHLVEQILFRQKIFGVRRFTKVPSDQLSIFISKLLRKSVVDEQICPVQSHLSDAHRSILEDHSIAFFGCADVGLCLPTLSDVLQEDDDSASVAAGVSPGVNLPTNPVLLSVKRGPALFA